MAVFADSGPKNSHFWRFLPKKRTTLNFDPNWTKLVQIEMTNYEWAAGPGPNYGEIAVFACCRKVKNRSKIRFSLYKHPPNGPSLLIIWENAIFF